MTDFEIGSNKKSIVKGKAYFCCEKCCAEYVNNAAKNIVGEKI